MEMNGFFDRLTSVLREDAQYYIDTFYNRWKTREAVLAFCFYFDSENGSIDFMLLPVSRFATHPSLPDVASWAYANPPLDAPKSDRLLTLLEEYSDVYFDDQSTAEQLDELRPAFISVLIKVLKQLSFDAVDKHPDFMVFAESMDEGWNLIPQTVDPALARTYFGNR